MTLQAVNPTELPAATSQRWQPLRCGLVDVFYYDNQEFWFRDGRLLLRGNNGTGKSKVLALTLPFLLDGELSASRVEPDGDRAKRMEWNLLLGDKYEERLGYTWLEFGRTTEDGERAYITVGCGLKAVAGRGIADRWFFLTSLRVGQDLFLIGGGTALTRDRLIEAVGQYGQVTQKAEQYRRMIDEHLFHLGAERYDALINLLIQLRQPQLSKRPDPQRLSRALSEALSPVDQAVLSDIAAAFHDLEQQRDELAGLRDTRGHVGRFLERYRRYASVAARRQGGELRSANVAYEQVGRDLGAVREEIVTARAAEDEAQRGLRSVDDELVERRAERDELATRPELRSFDEAEKHEAVMARNAAAAGDRVDRAERHRDERRSRHESAVSAAERTREGVTAAAETAAGHAERAGVGPEHASVLAPLDLPDGPATPAGDAGDPGDSGDSGGRPGESGVPPRRLTDEVLRGADRAVRDLAERRDAAVAHVTVLAETADATQADLVRARVELDEREADRDAAADRRAEAEDDLGSTIDQLVSAWREYAGEVTELALPQPDEIGLAAWAETVDGPNPALAALRRAAATSQQDLAMAHTGAQTQLADARAVLAGHEEEKRLLEAGELRPPPSPHTRPDGVRDGRPGAPLWQVVDFADGLASRARAGLEAALEASGLLDAWVTPDGRLLDPGTHDVVVTAGTPLPDNATAALRPAIDADDPHAAEVTSGTVGGILAGLGLGEGDVLAWVDLDGRWRIGPLRGEWAKPAAEFVGHAAREEARRRRLDEVVDLVTAAREAVERAVQDVAAVATRQATLAAEIDRQPADQALRDAHSAVATAARELDRAQRRVIAQGEAVAESRRKADRAGRERDEAAADLRLPTGLTQLREVRTAVAGYRTAAIELMAAVRRHADRLADVVTWRAELRDAEDAATLAAAEHQEADTEARAARTRLETLRSTIGATVEELTRRLDTAKARIDELGTESGLLTRRHREALERRAKAEGREQQLTDSLADASGRRDAAVHAFQRFATTGLLAVAVPELDIPDPSTPWAADPTVRLARRAEQALADADAGDDAWRKVQDDVSVRHRELSEALTRYGHHAVLALDDWLVVAIQFQGRERAPDELIDLLDDEIHYRERMLTARERELLEEHLVNDVASHLQELISDAEAQVGQMNAELAERPTSTGMRLRLRWEPRPDGPPGLAEARARLLRQDADLWSPDDRAAVGEFLQRQIEAVRAGDEYGTWQEHLRTALDYRAWHRFTIDRHADGGWRSALGPASGGERALTVSLPLFAAASAHYRSAHPHAPRLVLLDEAFAGIDDDARGKCLGLLATFDLDVMMTSEREWGFYATVPGIATHHLVRRDGIDAVHVTTWEWDGASRRQVDRVFAAHAVDGQPADGGVADGGGNLW